MRFILLFLLIALSRWGHTQVVACKCAGLVLPEHKGTVNLVNNPGGRVAKRMSHNFKQEDYLIWHANYQQGCYFYGTVSYSISGKSYTGWLRQAAWLGTYGRSYGATQKLPLYTEPRSTAPVKSVVPPLATAFYQIIRCSQGWVYVRTVLSGKVYEGWLAPNMQCANPYTTCS